MDRKYVIKIIGDIHGQFQEYRKLLGDSCTVQVGDFGFRYDSLDAVDSVKHKIVGGNHDNYDTITSVPHYLGDFGLASLGGVTFFFLRGAYSIDRDQRTIGVNWWREEEISIESFLNARELYRDSEPDIVITHDCPENVSEYLISDGARRYQTKTGFMLQELFNTHKPRLWRFGHYHKSWQKDIQGTNFRCLRELEVETLC